MKMRTRIAAGIVAGLALTGITSTANASPAEAATVIYGKCYYFTDQIAGYSRACWVDYNWGEEVFLRKKDCYCHITPILWR